MTAASAAPSLFTIIGLMIGGVGVVAVLFAAAAFWKSASRKAIAEQSVLDIESQGRTIAILKDRVAVLEQELAQAKRTIENMTSQIKSGEATQRLIETLEQRLRMEGK